MRLIILISICIFFQLNSIKSQVLTLDTIGQYYSGDIQRDFSKKSIRKYFKNKTVLLQEKYDNGYTHKEYIRYDDSTFVYSEYYDVDTTSVIKSLKCKRMGLVEISNQTGDTTIQFDPETYAQTVLVDTLLLPVGEWLSFFPNGQIKMSGNYKNYKRQGRWSYYDQFGNLEKTIDYSNNEVLKENFVNIIGEQSLALTKKYIKKMWISRDPKANGGYTPNPKYSDYKFFNEIDDIDGIGDIYNFDDDEQLQYTKTELAETKYEKAKAGLLITQEYDITKDLIGHWRLIEHNQLEIELEGKKEIFEIQYLFNNKLILRKIRS